MNNWSEKVGLISFSFFFLPGRRRWEATASRRRSPERDWKIVIKHKNTSTSRQKNYLRQKTSQRCSSQTLPMSAGRRRKRSWFRWLHDANETIMGGKVLNFLYVWSPFVWTQLWIKTFTIYLSGRKRLVGKSSKNKTFFSIILFECYFEITRPMHLVRYLYLTR